MKKNVFLKWLLFCIVAITFVGYSIVFPILPLLTLQRGGNVLLAGIIVAIYPIAQIIATPLIGNLSDKYGRKQMMLISLFGSFISFFMIAISHSFVLLLLARIIDGASGGLVALAQSYIADITPEKERTTGMGFIGAAVNLGFILGPIVGGVLGSISLALPFAIAAAASFLSIILALFVLPNSQAAIKKQKFHVSAIFPAFRDTTSWNFIVINFLIGIALGGFFTIASPFFSQEYKLSIFFISIIFAYTGFLTTVIRFFLLPLGLKVLKEKGLYFLAPLFGLIGMGFFLFPITIVPTLLGITIFSFGDSLLNPVTTGLLSLHISKEHQGALLGTTQSAITLGRGLGGILAGFVYSISIHSIGIVGAISYIVVFVLVLSFPIRGLRTKRIE